MNKDLPAFCKERPGDKSSINGLGVSDLSRGFCCLWYCWELFVLGLSSAGPGLGLDCVLENEERELFWDTRRSQTPLDPAETEGPASTLCLRTRYVKRCCCSCRIVKQEWSSSVSKCALPIIPEYPGFQDVKEGLVSPLPGELLLQRPPAHQPWLPGQTSAGVLQREADGAGELREQEVQQEDKTSAERTQTLRGCRRGSSCSAVLLVGHGKESQHRCSSANQHRNGGTECKAQKEIQNALKLCTGDLDLVTSHITAPPEALAQRK
ncbi:hypothetical protein DUI87_11447 [Hirundo rustica rustica]|uniref:Uncharacterized protein n=1 Tax=Hirundo rustica rustica TaxID=333673 RepID=A0A3M0KDN4_HIRRU|nr:hypothetical protein DUI87_11447 [Hirundo rustica rustica]